MIPETLTIHLNGNGGEPALSTMTESMDAVSAEGWSVPFRLGKVFDGWYLDAGCTVPFTGVNPEDYAGADAACWKYTPAGGNWTGLPVMMPDISFPVPAEA